MRVPYDWLQDYVSAKLPPPAELAEILTQAGLEVDGLERTDAGLKRVVVAGKAAGAPSEGRTSFDRYSSSRCPTRVASCNWS